MSGGYRAVKEVRVSIEVVRTMGEDAVREWVSRRNEGEWLVTGPRGGNYVAPAAQITVWTLDKDEFFYSGGWRFLGHRKEVRYIRPALAEKLRERAG